MESKIKYYEEPNFYGTEAYHKLSIFAPLYGTDGVKDMCDKLGCYWLADIIASYMKKYRNEGFLTFKVHLLDSGCEYIVEDGDYKRINKQIIKDTDLKENIQLFGQWTTVKGINSLIIMLPSEY